MSFEESENLRLMAIIAVYWGEQGYKVPELKHVVHRTGAIIGIASDTINGFPREKI